MDDFSSNLATSSEALTALSSEGAVGGVFTFLKSAGDWADAVAKLIGLVN